MKTGIRSFDVLDPSLDLKRNYLLEASAGTGKTFSIENIVVRLLNDDICLEEILVVTFTRAATRDLRVRIRANIERAMPSSKLKQALLAYDQAHIYTIHQFCYRMLREHIMEGNYSLDAVSEDTPLSRNYLLTIIRDYLRTEVNLNTFSKAQIKLILDEDLEETLLRAVTKGVDIMEPPSLEEQFHMFQIGMREIKKISILEEFLALSAQCKGIRDRKRQIKPEVMDRVQAFASLLEKDSWDMADFDWLTEDQLYLVKILCESNLKSLLKQHLLPCVSPEIIFCRMAHGCRKLLKKHLLEEEKLGFDELLEVTRQAIKNPKFIKAIRDKFKVAIIDEFQDTDPIQWEIFSQIFLENAYFYLVGDPKQSIYSFRQADIYTYIEAGKAIGDDNHATLDTNYRSQPSLIQALNALFGACPDFIYLPKLGESIPYLEVKCPPGAIDRQFSDGMNPLNFCLAKDEGRFFPYITQEIQKLHESDGLQFKEFAVLVSDRYQAQRVAEYLRQWNVPAVTQRSSTLAESEALSTLRDLLKAVLAPNHDSSLRTALGGRLIGWTHDQVRRLDELDLLQEVLTRFYTVRRKLFEEGFYSFFEYFKSSSSIVSDLLSQEGGAEFYQDLVAIVEILLDEQSRIALSPHGLLKFLDDFKILAHDDDEGMKRPLDPNQDAVSILTIHSSKGLEFGVVFTLGLIDGSRAPDMLIPSTKERILIPILDAEDPEYIRYCEELDAEKMRQLYVAMTRAKYRLYCPILPHSKEIKPGRGSPMELFLQKIGTVDFTDINDREYSLKVLKSDAIPHLEPPRAVLIPGEPKYVHSFTSLSKSQAKESAGLDAPHNFNAEVKSPHTLPAGSDTGNLLHLILEKGLESLAEPYDAWKPVIDEMIANVYAYRFPEGFTLPEVTEYFKETEFLYPYESHFLKGVIDMVFEYGGKYYIIDWKSNWLGPDSSFYSQERLESAMRENNYFLQAKLYEDALRKYLKVLDDRPFEEIFGGTYYFFLRGLGVYKC